MHVYSRTPQVMDFSLDVKNSLRHSKTTNLELLWSTGNTRAGQTSILGPTLSVVGPNSVCQMDSVRVQYGLSLVLLRSYAEHRGIHIADVLFYFCMQFGDVRYPLAMLRFFSMPDEGILAESSGTVYLCDQLDGPDGIFVLPVTDIHTVVSMFPEMEVSPTGQISLTSKFSLMCHTFIELSTFSSDGLFDEDYDNNTGM
ncbi:hypothetical protein EI94DRAFT_1801971 [Lactarius quietus]|nr:hypothetical protein EI94DRAFT_1801971 [Lactarius quietus]